MLLIDFPRFPTHQFICRKPLEFSFWNKECGVARAVEPQISETADSNTIAFIENVISGLKDIGA
ncbi:MAG: hypothetical protein HRU09_12445 [Oligoflexales bacterium]|nr:hypothetical protein [Oligoflexales bacterium]